MEVLAYACLLGIQAQNIFFLSFSRKFLKPSESTTSLDARNASSPLARPGHPRTVLSMIQFSPLVSRSILVRLAPNFGCWFPDISSPRARPGVLGPATLDPLTTLSRAMSARIPPPSRSATGRPLPREKLVTAPPTPRALVPGIPGDATTPRGRPLDAVLGPVVQLPRPRHRDHLITFSRRGVFR